MAGIDRFQEGHCFGAPDLAQDDAIRAHAQRRRQQRVSVASSSPPACQQGHDIWLRGDQFSGFFDCDDAFFWRDERQDLTRSYSLARRGAARDDHVQLVRDAEADRGVDIAAFDDISEFPISVLPVCLKAALRPEKEF